MGISKSPRAEAFKALAALNGPRLTHENAIFELLPYGLVPPPGGRTYDDRSIATITASVLEQALENAILTKLRALTADEERQVFSSESAPLSTFHAKIMMAYALDVIGLEAKADLVVIQRIRNTFAHSASKVTFDTDAVARACGLLSLPTRWSGCVPDGADARETFIGSAFQYVLYLMLCGVERSYEGESRVEKLVLG